MADKPADAVNTIQPAAVEKELVIPPAEDYTALIASKDEEIANWKAAALKYKNKAKQGGLDPDEDEEARIKRIVDERLANSEIARLSKEKDAIIAKALKENKELKLANMNKPDVPASSGAHSEAQPVKDTLITPEQLAALKAKGWSDKDIERYKKNLVRGGGR